MFYNKRKLAMYNFSISDMTNVICMTKLKGKKGRMKFCSSLFDFIKNNVPEGITFLNYILIIEVGKIEIELLQPSHTPKFSINISHNYFEIGHSHNEGDSMHGLIERRRKHQIIYVPNQCIGLVQCAKNIDNRYFVTELHNKNIFNFQKIKETKSN